MGLLGLVGSLSRRAWREGAETGPPSADECRRLHQTYGDRVYRFCHRLCGNPSDAEDLTAEVFLAAFQGLERFEGRGTLATWLFRIAVYRWRRMLRQHRLPTVPLEDAEELHARDADPGPARIEALMIEQALAELPDSLREAFLLVKIEGLKYREAAEVLDVPLPTVNSRVREAAARLRAALQQSEDPTVVERAASLLPPKECSHEV